MSENKEQCRAEFEVWAMQHEPPYQLKLNKSLGSHAITTQPVPTDTPWWLVDKIIAYASSKEGKANCVISRAQYDNALPKNRTDYDVPLGRLDAKQICFDCNDTGSVGSPPDDYYPCPKCSLPVTQTSPVGDLQAAILALPLPEPIWAGIDTHEGVQFHPSVEQAKSFSYDGEFTPYYGARQMRDLLAAAASLAALAQAPVAQGWQPIETAPKDGTEVLLWLQPPYNSIEKARWFDLWGNWQIGEFPEDSDEYCGIGSALPTHWMPIPTPPVIAHSADKESGNG
jgi:hypothetical protein